MKELRVQVKVKGGFLTFIAVPAIRVVNNHPRLKTRRPSLRSSRLGACNKLGELYFAWQVQRLLDSSNFFT